MNNNITLWVVLFIMKCLLLQEPFSSWTLFTSTVLLLIFFGFSVKPLFAFSIKFFSIWALEMVLVRLMHVGGYTVDVPD